MILPRKDPLIVKAVTNGHKEQEREAGLGDPACTLPLRRGPFFLSRAQSSGG